MIAGSAQSVETLFSSFLVLAVKFDSLRLPFLVLLALPFCLAGMGCGRLRYSNKIWGQRKKQTEEEEKGAWEVDEKIDIIDVSAHQPRRIPSKKWRALINPPSRFTC